MLSILIVVLLSVQTHVFGAPRVPCFFIFGDSLVDSGNNNRLTTTAKVNYLPYGVDFPKGPTGRFCNGRTVVDFIGEQLGFSQFITSYADSSKADITQGVNYASGSSGILDESGQHLGSHVSMNLQLKNHLAIKKQLLGKLGRDATLQLLNKCFYYVGIGSNDYINNYFMPEHYKSKSKYTPEQYAKFLTVQLFKQLTKLYNNGARKIAVVGTGNIGCTPDAITQYDTKGSQCFQDMNDAVALYNNHLKLLVDVLNNRLVGASFTFVNITAITLEPGLKVVSAAPCCPLKSDGLCSQGSVPCPDRKKTAFFDGFHPTEVINQFVADKAFSTLNQTQAYPVPISDLLQE